MSANPLKTVISKNREGSPSGLYSVCSANGLVLRGAIRHAVIHGYPLIIESTSNQVNQFGGYIGLRPHEFMAQVQKIAKEEGLPDENLILGGDHLGPLLWQHENEETALEKAVEMVKAYTLAGFGKIHLDTSMKLADDPSGPLDVRVCARRAAILARAVYAGFSEMPGQMPGQPRRPVLVIGSEVPIPGGSREHEDSVAPTLAKDFLLQVSVFGEEFQKAGIAFEDVVAFVVQPGVEFGDDFVYPYNPEKAASLTGALKTVPNLVFEGHSTDYQNRRELVQLVMDGVAILKVGPALSFNLREGLFLLEAVEEILVPLAARSKFKQTLLEEMDKSKQFWEKYYKGTPCEIEYKKFYSYSDRCRYYLSEPRVQNSIDLLLRNIPQVPPALLSQYFPVQYRRFMADALPGDPLSVLCDRIGDICADYASACGFMKS